MEPTMGELKTISIPPENQLNTKDPENIPRKANSIESSFISRKGKQWKTQHILEGEESKIGFRRIPWLQLQRPFSATKTNAFSKVSGQWLQVVKCVGLLNPRSHLWSNEGSIVPTFEQ